MLRTLGSFILGVLAGAAALYWLIAAGVLVRVPVPRPPVTAVVSPQPNLASAAPRSNPAPTPAPITGEAERSVDGRLRLSLPISGLRPEDVQDTFGQARDAGGRRHEATDILAPRNTPVLAVEDGVIVKLFLSKPGGLTIYQFDPEQNYCFYYAHLDHYPNGIAEGISVKRGDAIGYVGTTGNAPKDTPHLHFAIFRLGPEKRWWDGTAVNPYPLLMQAFGR